MNQRKKRASRRFTIPEIALYSIRIDLKERGFSVDTRCQAWISEISTALELVAKSGSYGHRMSAAAWESFHKATLELAKSTALKQRLTDAFTRHLQDMPASEMPNELRADFESLCRRMIQVSPQRGETAVVATVRKMSQDEADACATRIIGFLDALYRAKVQDTGATGNRLPADLGNGSRRSKPALDAAVRIPTLISINRA